MKYTPALWYIVKNLESYNSIVEINKINENKKIRFCYSIYK